LLPLVLRKLSLATIAACLSFAGLSGSLFAAVDPHTDNTLPVEPAASNARDIPASTPSRSIYRFHSPTAERSKFLTFPANGWQGGIIRWQYNDSGRLPSVASAAAMIAIIQAQQAKWSAVCNVQFPYDGPTTLAPSLLGATGTFDNVNVIAWVAQAAPQTGVTALGWGTAYSESDMQLNNTFNPDVGKTVLHELGHMLGLRHSNVEGAVMSGPNPPPDPSTSYVSLSALQADDIAGCVALYGAPTATAATISGTIPGGAASANITFCARPAAGVTCSPSTSTGAYSCTVPAGWTGVLHAAAPAGKRIRQQSFSNVTTALSAQNPLLQNVGSCELDVDNNGLFEPDIDGLAILRRMAGFNVSAFSGLSGTCAGNTTSAAVYAATASNYNVTGGAVPRPTTDGLLITRAMRKLTGTAVTQGATSQSWATVQSWLNSNCGSSF
jgi:hypothetical protein